MRKIKDWLLYPYSNCLLFTLLIWVLYSAGAIWHFFETGVYRNCIYIAAIYYVIVYLISLVVGLFKPISWALKAIILIVLAIFFNANIFCIRLFKTALTPDIMAIIRATNYDETKEFFLAYVGVKEILYAVSSGIVIWAIYRADHIVCRYLQKYAYISKTLIICLIFAVLIGYRNYGMVISEFDPDVHWIFNAEEVVDLRRHKTNPIISEIDSIHPSLVVLLVGESFSKNHSSLYGYNKQTNPNLEKLHSDSTLIVFENVVSPEPFTIQAFKYILNDYKKEESASDTKWYDSTTIIEAMSKVGYYTMWISNQSRTGIYDNLPGGYSRLCDEVYFNSHKGDGKYDGYLLTIDTDTATEAHDKCFIIYHFWGQHEMFEKRFPESFKHFTADDYPDYPDSPSIRAQITADYDNATLYNDYVASEIINLYKDDDALVIYFPDHGVNVYDTYNSFGHAINTVESIEHCKQIPFFVYVSPVLDRKAPNIKRNLLLEKDKAMCTDNLFDFVLRTAGYAKL